MASKLNRKFIFVVGGFSLAAVLLLVAVILVNQLWLKNADRHIRAGDELMAQGKAREAYAMYGRAVGKKPDVVRYIEKMEEALSKVTADTPAQSVEDYRSLMALKRQHTRAHCKCFLRLPSCRWHVVLTLLKKRNLIRRLWSFEPVC